MRLIFLSCEKRGALSVGTSAIEEPPMTKRGHFSKGVIETLMKRAGGLCSNPDCGRRTIGPSAAAPEKSDTVAVAAHIKGAQRGSARYDPEQNDEERHGIDNGIWLCSFCATLIDKNPGVDFPIETLRTWKIFFRKISSRRAGPWCKKRQGELHQHIDLHQRASAASFRFSHSEAPLLPLYFSGRDSARSIHSSRDCGPRDGNRGA